MTHVIVTTRCEFPRYLGLLQRTLFSLGPARLSAGDILALSPRRSRKPFSVVRQSPPACSPLPRCRVRAAAAWRQSANFRAEINIERAVGGLRCSNLALRRTQEQRAVRASRAVSACRPSASWRWFGRLFAGQDRGDDVGSEEGQSQKAGRIGWDHLLLAGDPNRPQSQNKGGRALSCILIYNSSSGRHAPPRGA
jgi:hypothetical protein